MLTDREMAKKFKRGQLVAIHSYKYDNWCEGLKKLKKHFGLVKGSVGVVEKVNADGGYILVSFNNKFFNYCLYFNPYELNIVNKKEVTL